MSVGDGLVDSTARIHDTYLYLCVLSEISKVPWSEFFSRYENEELSPSQALVLIHPAWYQHLTAENEACPVRGEQSFKMSRPPNVTCQSQSYWGYECPLDRSQAPEVDHRVPYSLGGPTRADNAVWLCQWHNRAKGSDIHMVDLDPEKMRWFDSTLQRVRQLLSG